jgi:hypothetical protein
LLAPFTIKIARVATDPQIVTISVPILNSAFQVSRAAGVGYS